MVVKEEEESDLLDGCRIVELSVLAQGLSACIMPMTSQTEALQHLSKCLASTKHVGH